jgi:ubiquinone biosynthesis protein UbiJ
MERDEIDWDHSIEQQIDEIVIATATARRLVRQIKDKRDAHPELITKETYAYFQSAIHSMAQLVREVEGNPLYGDALRELRKKQRRKQQQVLARYFGDIAVPGEPSH